MFKPNVEMGDFIRFILLISTSCGVHNVDFYNK